MNSLSLSTPEAQSVAGELLDGSGFEAEDPATDLDPTELRTEEDSEQ